MSTSHLVFSINPFDSDGSLEDTIVYAPDPGKPCEIAFPEDSLDVMQSRGRLIVVGDESKWRVFIAHLSRKLPRVNGASIYPRCFILELGKVKSDNAHKAVLECLELAFDTTIEAHELDRLEVDYRD